MLDVKKIYFIEFKGICMNFLLELKKYILSHPVTYKQPHKIVQIYMAHPLECLLLKLNLKNNYVGT